ncbi:MAG TPA: FtsX-like permease family protein, partial [Candidatus Coprenecus stercoravium]|nr:FtsX-like permease family protein [Candidatus Coprenecus stercoravium]
GENPVGKQFGDAAQLGGSWRVSGVIEPVKIIKDQEYRSFVMFANADITKDQNEIEPVWCFRLRPGVDEDAFIADASRTWKEQMRYGNYRVGSILSLDDTLRRETVDNFTWQALFIFLLICMLIGVASFAWLRTRERRGEIGVRRAMGGTAGSVMLTLLCEVWSLYAVSLLTGLLLVINTIVIGKIDFCSSGMYIGFVSQPIVDSLPLIFEPVPHFLVVAGIAALILLAAVTLSTIVPVAGALKESPADVLKDE